MPRRYRKRQPRRRRRRTRRPRKSNTLTLQKSVHSKLRYGEQILIAGSAAGSASVYNFTANGLYDPNITGVGHQPRNFDQLMGFYDHYIVKGSKMIARFSHEEADPIVVGILQRDSASTGTLSPTDILEYPKARFVTIPGVNSNSVATVVSKCSVSKFLGRKVMGDPDLKGSTAANPTEQVYFQIVIWKPNNSAWTGNVACDVTIDYATTFVEPKLGNSS